MHAWPSVVTGRAAPPLAMALLTRDSVAAASDIPGLSANPMANFSGSADLTAKKCQVYVRLWTSVFHVEHWVDRGCLPCLRESQSTRCNLPEAIDEGVLPRPTNTTDGPPGTLPSSPGRISTAAQFRCRSGMPQDRDGPGGCSVLALGIRFADRGRPGSRSLAPTLAWPRSARDVPRGTLPGVHGSRVPPTCCQLDSRRGGCLGEANVPRGTFGLPI